VSPASLSIAQALRSAQQQGLERLDSQMLLLHACQQPVHQRAWLTLHQDDALSPTQAEIWKRSIEQRLSGQPVAYIVGYKDFYGLTLKVDARVLVPRPDTETLVDWALEVFPHIAVHAIDLGTGSGAIALALKQQRPLWNLTGIDVSPHALEVARQNAQALQLDVCWKQGHWLAHIRQSFDLIVSNPPYIAAQDPHLRALQHEPLLALTSGADGLEDIRTIIAQATMRLRSGGWLLLEHGYDQAAAVRALLQAVGFTQVQSRHDLAGIARCSGGCWIETPR
jgi:release factor glutamine methyltransferase